MSTRRAVQVDGWLASREIELSENELKHNLELTIGLVQGVN